MKNPHIHSLVVFNSLTLFAGPFWYASGATVQIILFATLAIALKKRAPNAHTFLETIKARYGPAAHYTFMLFGIIANTMVSLMLIVGGSATINALTGMHRFAAIFLMPIPVVAYTFVGGLKATFITDYIHGFAVLIIIITFALTAYQTSDVLGSPSAVYDLLVEAAKEHPVEGNKDGSYLTFQSSGGGIFFVIVSRCPAPPRHPTTPRCRDARHIAIHDASQHRNATHQIIN